MLYKTERQKDLLQVSFRFLVGGKFDLITKENADSSYQKELVLRGSVSKPRMVHSIRNQTTTRQLNNCRSACNDVRVSNA